MARYNWFEKRKSRKQLIQEIEALEKEIEELENRKEEYRDKWLESCDAYHSISKKIKTITAVCVSIHDEKEWGLPIKESLCVDLAKEMLPYVTFESYKMVGEPWDGEAKHIATVHIVE